MPAMLKLALMGVYYNLAISLAIGFHYEADWCLRGNRPSETGAVNAK